MSRCCRFLVPPPRRRINSSPQLPDPAEPFHARGVPAFEAGDRPRDLLSCVGWERFSPAPEWGRAIIRVARRLAPQTLHVPLLLGASRRDRIAQTADPERSALVLPFIEREFAPLLRPEAWSRPAGSELLQAFSQAVLGLELATHLSPGISDLWRQRLALRLQALWPAVRGLISHEPGAAIILYAELADALNLLIIDHSDIELMAATQLLADRLAEEAMLGTDMMISRVLSRVVETAPDLDLLELADGTMPEVPREMRQLVNQARQLRQQALLAQDVFRPW